MTPIDRQVNNMDVPPKLTSGSGCPVVGKSLTETAMLMRACMVIIKPRPMANVLPKGRPQIFAVIIVL